MFRRTGKTILAARHAKFVGHLDRGRTLIQNAVVSVGETEKHLKKKEDAGNKSHGEDYMNLRRELQSPL